MLTPLAHGQSPSETRQGEQWAVAPGTVFDLPGAWDLTRGEGVVVAVVDSGMRLDHPDLARNVWTNFEEVPGNGVDDDKNGYVDDVHGVDLTTRSRKQDLRDGNGHGTHVSGIIAAAANGARIINLSLGGPTHDTRMDAAIKAAGDANVLVVCSAGNESRDIDRKPSWPVSVAARNLVGVAATAPDAGRRIGDFSNFGRLTVPLAAPGAEVLSTSRTGGYEYKSGTSMAAPHATGVAALMAAVRPDASADELRAMILQAAARSPLPVGAGYLDALSSVLLAMKGSSYQLGQPPVARILYASAAGRGRRAVTMVQVAILGSRQAIRRYRVSLGGRVAATLAARGSPFTVRIRGRRAGRVRVDAIDRRSKTLASATRRVRAVTRGKRDVRRGPGLGGQVGIR